MVLGGHHVVKSRSRENGILLRSLSNEFHREKKVRSAMLKMRKMFLKGCKTQIKKIKKKKFYFDLGDDTDYEPWQDHSLHRANEDEDVAGCLLGQRVTLMRLKKDSWYCDSILFIFRKKKTIKKFLKSSCTLLVSLVTHTHTLFMSPGYGSC